MQHLKWASLDILLDLRSIIMIIGVSRTPVKLFPFSYFDIGGILQFWSHLGPFPFLKRLERPKLQDPPNIEKGIGKKEITSRGCQQGCYASIKKSIRSVVRSR